MATSARRSAPAKKAAKPATKPKNAERHRKAAPKPKRALGRGRSSAVERRDVAPAVEGSIPSGHPQAPAAPADDLDPITLLSPKQALFAREYLVDLNGTQAYLRAFPHVTVKTAGVEGSRLLANPRVAAVVAREARRIAENVGITAERALQEVWDIATADVTELVEFRRVACQSCYPAQRAAGQKVSRQALPDPDCEECDGDGFGRPVFKDTRYASPAARRLFAGVKVTDKGGIEYKLQDRGAAQERILKHLGLYEADNRQKDATLAEAFTKLVSQVHNGSSLLPIAPARRPDK